MYEAPESPRRSVYAAPGSALDTAQQHLRDMHERDERIHDIETALRRLEDERKKYVHTWIITILRIFLMQHLNTGNPTFLAFPATTKISINFHG